MKSKTTKYIVSALFCALIAAFSQICIPLPMGIPITLQSLAICLTGYLLGAYYGCLSVVAYIILGAVGVPVFTFFGAGPSIVFGQNGGFIIGFLPLCFMCGISSFFKSDYIKICFGTLGIIICHICGILMFRAVYGSGFIEAFFLCSAPFLLKDFVCVASAYIITKQLNKRTKLFKGLSAR